MTLPSSGSISLSQVNTELGLSATALITMNDSAVRTLFQKTGSGTAISMSDGYGKANQFAFTISSNQTNANLRTLAVNAGWNETSKVVATISSGIYISSNGTGTPALTVSGSFPGGVELINGGTIVGMGGAGGNGGGYYAPSVLTPTAGAVGGTAFSVSSAITVVNNGTIAGGGGGGGGGGARAVFDGYGTEVWGGGGGGGGRSSNASNSSGGTGGPRTAYSGGSGAAGGAGTVSAAGGGGAGGSGGGIFFGGAGGAGGAWGASGATGGNSGGSIQSGAGGGSGGNAVSGNSNITWTAFGTRLGGIT
jgi:hypothetical protein